MRKLVLIPVVVVTGFLLFAFLQPSAAAAVARTVTASLPVQVALVGSSSLAASEQSSQSQSDASNRNDAGSASHRSATSDSTGAFLASDVSQHAVSTTPRQNCGRFGNGFHGGKHLFVCPNRPFPAPANH
jgi:hypothetical protein